MEFLILILILILIAGGIWYYLRSKGSASVAKPTEVELPIKITVTTSSGGSTAPEKVNTGAITETSDGGFILNPKSPFPLTITGLARSEANTLKSYLDEESNWDRKLLEIIFLVAKYNVHCREIDEYVAKYRSQYLGTIERLKTQSSEWNSASEKDKKDLLAEFKQQAIEELPEKPGSNQEILSILFEHEPVDATADDQLISLFGRDMETYRFYLYELKSIGKVQIVPADHYYRKSYETLVQKGVAKRGQDIGLAEILDGLRLKDVNEVLLQGLIEKPFGRKAKAIEFALTVPNMVERLNKQIAFRELFQITKPEGIDVAEIQKCYEHANAVAFLLRNTYLSGVRTLRELEQAKDTPFDYWEIFAEECCKICRHLHGKRYKRRPSRLPPFHIGCDCMLEGGYN
jgi:hypothetical protein